MDETIQYIYQEVMEHWMPTYFKSVEYTPWICALIGSAFIGLSGILPLFVIPFSKGGKDGAEFNRKCYLSRAHIFLNHLKKTINKSFTFID